MHPRNFRWRNRVWCVFQLSPIVLTSGIAADSAQASPLDSLPAPQPDPPTLQKPLTRLPLTSQPSPLPTPTPPEAFPNQGGSLDTATANRRGRFDGETPRRGESYEFLHRSDESPAPGLPQDERQLTSLYSSVSKTTSLHSSSVESTPQDSLCFETNSAGELENSPDTITVSRFEFVINHLAKTDEELKNFTRDYLNKPLSPAQLLSVATLITKYYVARGFITSHAIVCIPKLTQQQGKGVVQIRLISGELDRIDEKLSPAFQEEKKSGAAQSFSTSLSFDTSLFSRLPTFQQKVVFSEANLLGMGDGLSVGYTHTEVTNDWDISYTLPLNARDGTLSFAYSQSETYASESPSENIQEAGNSSGYELASRSYELTLRQPVRRSFLGESDRFKEQQPTHEELALGLTAFLGESSTTLSKVPFPFSSWSDDNGLTRTLALRFLMEWKRENAQEVIELRSQFSFGLNTFGSTTNEPNAEVNQVVLSNHFFSWQGQAQWSRFLAKDTVLLLRANAQLADGALVPLEQFALGGKGSVRGYSQDFLLTDNGIKASAEVQLPVLRVFREKGVIQVVPFVDWGMVWNSSGGANPSPNSLASVGLGLQWQQGDFTARLDWGIPLVSVDSQDGTGQENGLYFSVQYNH
ncbi:ShlB/FhaC/HecB family hemolysin secretion/activation protein [Microcoleus sp. FACHB-53]|nr:ShlB/FhaC/HecB family hemolysin secretion/activation protein [Microcoleus sp. FACHB-53]